MAKAKKLPSGNWRVNQYIGTDEHGKKKFKSFTAATKKEAEYMAAEYVMYRKSATGTNMTVYAAIDEYIASKENILSPSTIRSYKVMRSNRLKIIGNIKLSALTQIAVQKAINEEAAISSPKTVRNINALLSAALKQHNIQFDIALPQKEKKEITIPTKKDIDLLLSLPLPQDMHFAILLASCMGLRRSEICALTLEDFDLKQKILTVNKAKVRNSNLQYIIKKTKTYSGTRKIPIPQKVIDEISQTSLQDPIIKRTPEAISLSFDRIVKKHLDKNVRFHDLRHYYASVLLSLNVPDKYAMDLMGHSSTNMLKTVYQHLMPDKKQQIADALNHFF